MLMSNLQEFVTHLSDFNKRILPKFSSDVMTDRKTTRERNKGEKIVISSIKAAKITSHVDYLAETAKECRQKMTLDETYEKAVHAVTAFKLRKWRLELVTTLQKELRSAAIINFKKEVAKLNQPLLLGRKKAKAVDLQFVPQEPIPAEEELYCRCRRLSFGKMIKCDNKKCKIGWFHFECVGVRSQLKGKWFCAPECKKAVRVSKSKH